ncbi:unnamed protein product, partial [Rangifer tarandus platyrhynchus]
HDRCATSADNSIRAIAFRPAAASHLYRSNAFHGDCDVRQYGRRCRLRTVEDFHAGPPWQCKAFTNGIGREAVTTYLRLTLGAGQNDKEKALSCRSAGETQPRKRQIFAVFGFRKQLRAGVAVGAMAVHGRTDVTYDTASRAEAAFFQQLMVCSLVPDIPGDAV